MQTLQGSSSCEAVMHIKLQYTLGTAFVRSAAGCS